MSITIIPLRRTVYPKKYAHGFCFAVLCCGYTLTDFPISIKLTSLALWQSNDCPSASKATLMNMDKYFMWIHYERLHNHNKAKHNKTVCIFLGIYCICTLGTLHSLPYQGKAMERSVGKITRYQSYQLMMVTQKSLTNHTTNKTTLDQSALLFRNVTITAILRRHGALCNNDVVITLSIGYEGYAKWRTYASVHKVIIGWDNGYSWSYMHA